MTCFTECSTPFGHYLTIRGVRFAGGIRNMKNKSPDILWVLAAILAGGLLFSAVSEGGVGVPAPAPVAAPGMNR